MSILCVLNESRPGLSVSLSQYVKNVNNRGCLAKVFQLHDFINVS